MLGVPSYPLAHERRYAASLLNVILGGGMSSRLFQNIRERQGLAYAIESDLSPYTDSGVLSVYAGTSRESAAQLIRSVCDEFRSVRGDGVSAEELRRAKDHLKGSMMLSLESTSARMSNLARQAMYLHRFISLDEMLASIEAVTREEVHAIARDFFEPGPHHPHRARQLERFSGHARIAGVMLRRTGFSLSGFWRHQKIKTRQAEACPTQNILIRTHLPD